MNHTTLFRTKSIERIQADAAAGYSEGEISAGGLKRALGVMDLTLLGIAAVIGAGIFSTIGTAASNGGPAVALLFVFTAIACAFAALCYAEFASMIPVAGSARSGHFLERLFHDFARRLRSQFASIPDHGFSHGVTRVR
jgi:amino acid permease